jgi:shikimate dehydrogenase
MSDFAPTAAAAMVVMIGQPIAQAFLPARFNAWFRDEGLNALMAPIDLAPERLGDFFASLRGWANCRGCVVTAPHKQAVAGLVDALTPRAALLGAVNLVVRADDGTLEGDNVDGAGFVAALRGNAFEIQGARAIVFGCGGAGSSIALALAENGAAALHLVDREPGRAVWLTGLVAGQGHPAPETGAPERLGGFDLVINASAAGLGGQDMVFPLDTLRPGALVADVVTGPVVTPWLEAAQARGCRIQTGPEMAAGQFGLIAARFGFPPVGS